MTHKRRVDADQERRPRGELRHRGAARHYSLTVTNTGNITLHNVTVSDTPDLDGFSCAPAIPVAALAPTESGACTGTHTIAQADLDAGTFLDTGHATSTETDAPDVIDIIQGAQNAVLALTKTDDLNPATYDTVGQVVTYTLTATNTGNVTLHDVSVSDTPALDGFSSTPAIPVAALATTESITCTGTHTITQADLDARSFTDTGHATSTETVVPDVTDTIQAAADAVLALTKTDSFNPATYDTVGQVVTFTLTATNTGNVTLHNVSISDTPDLDGFSCAPAIPVAALATTRSSPAPAPTRSPKATSTPDRSPTPATPPAPKSTPPTSPTPSTRRRLNHHEHDQHEHSQHDDHRAARDRRPAIHRLGHLPPRTDRPRTRRRGNRPRHQAQTSTHLSAGRSAVGAARCGPRRARPTPRT